MASVNKAIIVGHLGADPEMRYTPDGKAVCTLSIATSEQWTDAKTGARKEQTEWHRVIAWERLAEACGKYLARGRQCYVEGKIQTRKWQDKEGRDRYTTEIKATAVQFLGKGERETDAAKAQEEPGAPANTPDADVPF